MENSAPTGANVTIGIERFIRFIKTELTLDIVKDIYFASESFELQDRLSLLFGPKPNVDED
jgi:hypothetical protein